MSSRKHHKVKETVSEEKTGKGENSKKKIEKKLKKALNMINSDLEKNKKKLQKLKSADATKKKQKAVRERISKLKKKTGKLDKKLSKMVITGNSKEKKKTAKTLNESHSSQTANQTSENHIPTVPELIDEVLHQDNPVKEISEIFNASSINYNAREAIAYLRHLASPEEVSIYVKNEKRKTVRAAAEKKREFLMKKSL